MSLNKGSPLARAIRARAIIRLGIRLGWAVAAGTLLGCDDGNSSGGGDDASATKPSLRLANAVPSSTLTLNAVGGTDSATFSTGAVASAAVSDYVSSSAQTYTVGVHANPATLTPATHTVPMSGDVDYTLLAFARSGAINTFLLTDTLTAPVEGFSVLAVANAASDAGTLDVYLVAPGATLNGVSPHFTSLGSRSTSTGRTLAAGTYDIVATGAGKPGDVRVTLPSVTLASTKVNVLALTSTAGGGLVDGVMVDQGGSIGLFPNKRSRVRVVGAFPSNGTNNHTVAVTVGVTALGSLTAPSVGAYKLVPGGTSNYSVVVNGASVENLPAANFMNGGDYTVLVAGDPSLPRVAIVADNNQPSSSGFAHLRLINAAVDGGLTLYHNYLPINVDVPLGSASTYEPVAPSTASLLQITSPVAAFPGYSASNLNISGNGVYTIFVLGSVSAPVVSLSKDR